MLRSVAIICFFVASELSAAVVIEDANLSWGPDGPFPGVPDGNYRAKVFQDAGASDHTSAWFHYDGSSIRGITANLDQGSAWYVVSAGQALTQQTIQQGLVAPLITSGPIFHPSVKLIRGQDVYLGVVTGQGNGPEDRDVYGWVLLRPVGAFLPTLTMIDNTMSYQSEGIIVGTSIVVPEPTHAALVGGMLLSLILSWRMHLVR
jgi:hypothetical protein